MVSSQAIASKKWQQGHGTHAHTLPRLDDSPLPRVRVPVGDVQRALARDDAVRPLPLVPVPVGELGLAWLCGG